MKAGRWNSGRYKAYLDTHPAEEGNPKRAFTRRNSNSSSDSASDTSSVSPSGETVTSMGALLFNAGVPEYYNRFLTHLMSKNVKYERYLRSKKRISPFLAEGSEFLPDVGFSLDGRVLL